MSSTFLSDFTTRYMDPTEVKARFTALAAEFPNIATLVPLPYKTNGYQRKAQATLAANATTLQAATAAGATAIRVASHDRARRRDAASRSTSARTRSGARSRSVVTPNPAVAGPERHPDGAADARARERRAVFSGESASGNTAAGDSQPSAVVLTSRAWGHEGGNDITVEFRDPGGRELAAERRGRRDEHPRHARRRTPTGDLTSTAAAGHRRDQRQPGVRARSSRRSRTAVSPARGSCSRGRR